MKKPPCGAFFFGILVLMNNESHPGRGPESENLLKKINEDFERIQAQEQRAPRLPDSVMNDFWKGVSDKLARE